MIQTTLQVAMFFFSIALYYL